jgi:hypothetical protein
MNMRTLRRRGARRSLYAATAACGLLVGTSVGGASAMTVEPTQRPTPSGDPDAGKVLESLRGLTDWKADAPDAAATEALSERFGLSTEDARAQLEASAFGEELSEKLATSYPDQYAGAWISYQAPSGLSIGLTDQDLANDLARTAESFPFKIDVVVREHSVAELDAALLKVTDALGIGAKDGDSKPPESLIVEVAGPEGAIRVRTGPSAKQVEEVALALAGLDTAGVPLIFDSSGEGVDVANDVCYVTYCPPSEGPFRGTLQIRPDANGDGQADNTYCTAGFNAKRTISGSSQWLVTTAGHCSAGFNVNWKHSTGQDLLIGPDKGSQTWNTVDGAIIQINDPSGYWKPQNTIWRPSNNNYPITQKISTPGSSLWGNWICHAGSNLGGYEACGTLITHNAGFGNNVGMGSVQAPACPGDSGGPWFNGSTNRAYGLHKGSTNASACPGPSNETSYFTWVSNFEAAFGGGILTAPVGW